MIDPRPIAPHDRCTDKKICQEQDDYQKSNIGKLKVKYQGGMSYCFFCKVDLRARMYQMGIKVK